MASPVQNTVGSVPADSRRKSILDLAPLELDCMNALWPLGEATVRDVQQAISAYRPRAYTTIMTILDRLAHKGVVTRRKIGRAYLYRASLLPEKARDAAVERLVRAFFGGSRQALAQHIGAEAPAAGPKPRTPDRRTLQPTVQVQEAVPSAAGPKEPGESLDETLL